MRRRLLITALGCGAATRLLAGEPAGRPHQKISANALRDALVARFPMDFAVPGLFEVRLDAGRLLLLPARQRVGATLLARITDLSAGQAYPGTMDLTFALRYEASDRTLRAHDLEVARLKSPALTPEAAESLQALVDGFARSAVEEVVLHRFTQGELGLVDVMGLAPQTITVERDGVEIWFAPAAPGRSRPTAAPDAGRHD